MTYVTKFVLLLNRVRPFIRRLLSPFGLIFPYMRGLTSYEWMLVAAMAIYSAVFSIYLIQKYEFFRTGYFDFGSLVQQAWLVSHGHITSFALGRPMNIIAAGLYSVVPRPETLLVFQSFMLAIGALPLYAIALKELGRRGHALVISLLYLTSPALWGVNQYEYHDMAMVIPMFIFAFYFYVNGNKVGYLISFLLALISSQLAVVIGLFMSLSFALDYLRGKSRQKLRFILITVATAVAWAIYLELSTFLPYYTFATFPSKGYTLFGSSQFVNPLIILSHPVESIAYAWADKFRYIVYLLSPLLFLPLLSLRKLLPAFPWLAIVVGYSPMLGTGGVGPVYQLYSNWSSFLLPFFFVSAIYGLKRFSTGSKDSEADSHRLKQILALMIVISLSIALTTGAFSPVSTPVNLSGGDSTVPTDVDRSLPYHGIWPTPVRDHTILNSFVALIPQDYSVMTQNVVGSKLAERLAPVYIFYQPGYKDVQTDAILIDSNVDGLCSICVNNLLSTGNYTLYASYSEGGIYLYFKTNAI